MVYDSHLCESWGRGRVWDRSGSRYRLWWFVHFTFLCGSALGWPSLASLSLKKQKNKKNTYIISQINSLLNVYKVSTKNNKYTTVVKLLLNVQISNDSLQSHETRVKTSTLTVRVWSEVLPMITP